MNLKFFGQARAVGVNIGTSGVRAAAVDSEGRPVAASKSAFKTAGDTRTPAFWSTGVEQREKLMPRTSNFRCREIICY